MSEVERRYTRPGWRYIFGVISLVLAGISGAVLVALVVLFRIGEMIWGPAATSEIDAPGIGLLVFFVVLACLLSVLTSLFLAAAALVKPGRGWRFAVAGWVVGASALVFAGAQNTMWSPYGGVPEGPLPDAAVIQDKMPQPEMSPKVMEGMMMEDMGASPGSPPQAILTSARRDAVGLEGTFCWTPGWADNCVEDAGIPLPQASEALAVKRGKTLNLAFVLRSSEGQFDERNPDVTKAVAYPLEQETKTIPMPPEDRYLVPDGSSRALNKKPLGVEGGPGLSKITADVPEGEYVFQVSARSPEPSGEVESWLRAQYHFRVKVLPRDGE